MLEISISQNRRKYFLRKYKKPINLGPGKSNFLKYKSIYTFFWGERGRECKKFFRVDFF